jgi:hypothetical protein
MKFVVVRRSKSDRGVEIDPRDYLAKIPDFSDRLPEGARGFALQEGHYDFSSRSCVKDLKVSSMSMSSVVEGSLEIKFEPNQWKHDSGLTVTYQDVTRVEVSSRSVMVLADLLGSVLVDEILPDGSGCSHEISLRDGSVFVQCRDLVATWG